ncbi:MAG: VOC family protein [Chloroflexota bacterium]
MANHNIVHIEFSAQDREAAGKFYSEAFGWKIQQFPEMNYTIFETEDGPGGGFNPVSENNPAGTVLVHIATDDIEDNLAKIESLGGSTLVPKTEIPQVGWFAIFTDPTGNQVALYTSLKPGA